MTPRRRCGWWPTAVTPAHEYAALFRGLDESELVAPADSFALENCAGRTPAARHPSEVVKRGRLGGDALAHQAELVALRIFEHDPGTAADDARPGGAEAEQAG
jgi:hypothetical protein